jgi:hypothetical protein
MIGRGNRSTRRKPVPLPLCPPQTPPELELLYYRWFVANQFVLATSPFRLTTSDFILQLNTWGYNPYVTFSLTRGWVCRFNCCWSTPAQSFSGLTSCGTHDHILLSQIRDSPNLEGQVPVFISPRNRVVWLYRQALGSLFVASYDSQGYGGGIRPRLHTGITENGNTTELKEEQSTNHLKEQTLLLLILNYGLP